MFVWQWVQQHRLLSVIVLALVFVSCAGGTAWALVFRTVSSPVGLREALRIYRREQSGKMLATWRNRMPVPGVYTYRTSGGESLNLVGVARSFPSSTSMIVADGRCANVSWVPITQHTESTTVCNTPNGALTMPKLVTDESIAGSTTTSTIQCPASTYLLPPAARPGQHWGATCSLANPAEKIMLAGHAMSPTSMVVDGHSVSVVHTRVTLTFTGAEHGSNPTDYWIVPSSGLIVREQETVGVTQGSVHYTENMETTLTSLDPARLATALRPAPVGLADLLRRRADQRRQALRGGEAVALGDHLGHLVPIGRDAKVQPHADPALGPDVLRHEEAIRFGRHQHLLRPWGCLHRHGGAVLARHHEELVAHPERRRGVAAEGALLRFREGEADVAHPCQCGPRGPRGPRASRAHSRDAVPVPPSSRARSCATASYDA